MQHILASLNGQMHLERSFQAASFQLARINPAWKLQGGEEVAEKDSMSTVRCVVPYVRHEPGVGERLIGPER